MASYFFLGIFFLIAHKTNPDKESFGAFITNTNRITPQSSAFSKISTFLTRVTTTAPPFTYQSYIFFSIVNLKDESATYIGLFSKWFVLSEVFGRTRSLRGESNSAEGDMVDLGAEAMAERDQNDAIDAKKRRDFVSAGQSYLAAAHKLERSSEDSLRYQAATCYEDAFKAFNQTDRTDDALRALDNAANMFESLEKYNSRAGRLFEQLGDFYQKDNGKFIADNRKALKMFEKAARCFDIENDSRARTMQASAATLHIQLGDYNEALTIFNKLIPSAANDSIGSFRVKEFAYLSCLCCIAKEEWVGLERKLRDFEDLYPALWNDTRESKFILALLNAHSSFDSEAFGRTCQEYDRYTPLPNWQIQLLLKAKKSIEAIDLR